MQSRAEGLRTLLLAIIPVFGSYLVSHGGTNDFDAFRSFAGAFLFDLEQVLSILRRHDSKALLGGIDVLEKALGMLQNLIKTNILGQFRPGTVAEDYRVSTITFCKAVRGIKLTVA